MQQLRGSFWVLVLYDVAEQIQLDSLRDIVGAEHPRREPSFKHPAPEYVRFERPPVVEYPGPISIVTGEQFRSRIKYFDYGVVSVGLFGGPGFSRTMAGFTHGAHIPAVFAFLAIMAAFLGGIGLIVGFLTRIAAFGVLCNMVVAVVTYNSRFGFFMNWSGKQKGEGFEFHLLAIAILLGVLLRGAGPASIDRAIAWDRRASSSASW